MHVNSPRDIVISLSVTMPFPEPEMTFPEVVKVLNSTEACSRTEYPQFMKPTRDHDHTKPSLLCEFPQFASLPQELQYEIWRFALPSPCPLQINTYVNNQRQVIFVWGIGPFAMMEVCRQSRRTALSAYKPRIELYTSQDGRVLCTTSKITTKPKEHIYIYTRYGNPPINSHADAEVHSIVSWKDIPLGCKVMDTVSPATLGVMYFRNWPPEEDESLVVAIICKDRYEQCKDRVLPLRLQNLRLSSSFMQASKRPDSESKKVMVSASPAECRLSY
jgi:hypothetical protein